MLSDIFGSFLVLFMAIKAMIPAEMESKNDTLCSGLFHVSATLVY